MKIFTSFSQDEDTCFYHLYNEDLIVTYESTDELILILNKENAFQLKNNIDSVIQEATYDISNDTLTLFLENTRIDVLCVNYYETKSDSIEISWLKNLSDQYGGIFLYAADTINLNVNGEQYRCPPSEFSITIPAPIFNLDIPYMNIYNFVPRHENGFDIGFMINSTYYEKPDTKTVKYSVIKSNSLILEHSDETDFPLKFQLVNVSNNK